MLSRILVRYLLKIPNTKMALESDLNPIGNLIRNLSRILVRFLLKIRNRKMVIGFSSWGAAHARNWKGVKNQKQIP
jgi:hypothetical protein